MNLIRDVTPLKDVVLERYEGKELETGVNIVVIKSKHSDSAIMTLYSELIKRVVDRGHVEILYFYTLQKEEYYEWR